MNLQNFRDGLAILAEHFNRPDGYHIGAEHDEFFVHATDHLIPPLLVAKLREMGWRQEHWRGGEGDYMPTEGWSCYT